ncbi:MAG: hypothetical protein JJ992_24280 [Planctomycetes bacterium]|nr:hypothetical protein [Planctomycetota bacterium]
MSNIDIDAAATAQNTEPEPPSETTLDAQLKELKEKQAAAAAEQVDANIADLTKLIADTDKAEEDYAKAHEHLADQEARLKAERDTLQNALKAALGMAGIDEVKAIVTAKVKEVTDAEITRDNAKTAVADAQKNADEKAKALVAAQAKLDTWRKPVSSIGARLNTAEALIAEIKKLRNVDGREEAYWKLALGDHADVPGQEFLNEVLSRQPGVVHPDNLRSQIRTAWNEFRAARTEAAKAKAVLAMAQADLKQKEADYADKSKNLIKAISGALADREGASDAA